MRNSGLPDRLTQFLVVFFLVMFSGVLWGKAKDRLADTQFPWYAADVNPAEFSRLKGSVCAAMHLMQTVQSTSNAEFMSTRASKKYAKVGQTISTTDTSTLWDEIQRQAGSDAETLIAIAIHESGGLVGGSSSTIGAQCAFQVLATNCGKIYNDSVAGFMRAKGYHNPTSQSASDSTAITLQTRAKFMHDLKSSAKLCTEGGLFIYKWAKGVAHGDPGKAVCYYGGQAASNVIAPTSNAQGYTLSGKRFSDNGTCPAAEEIRIIKKLMAASGGDVSNCKNVKGFTKVNDDPESSDYGKEEYTEVGGSRIDPLQAACADPANAILRNLANAAKAFQAAAIVRVRDSDIQSLKNTATKLRGSVKAKQCLGVIVTFYQTIRDLLSGISAVIKAIEALIQSLLDQVCQYVATAINNALASVCIPLPNLSLSASLPSLSASSCSGVSLMNVLKAVSGGTSSSSSSSSSTDADSTVVPPVDMRGPWDIDRIGAPMLRSVGTDDDDSDWK